MPRTPKEEFVDFMTESVKFHGFDDLSARMLAMLFITPHEISMDELSKITGYSLSALSTASKNMENMGMIHRVKKPKSRKIYIYMGKSMIDIMLHMLKAKQEKVIGRAKDLLPKIISRYRSQKHSKNTDELKIVEDYYSDVLRLEKIIAELIARMEGLKD